MSFRFSGFFLFLIVFAFPGVAQASCAKHPLSGVWKAQSYTKVSPKTVEIIYNCRSKPQWVVRVLNSCSPADCIWGRTPARRHLSGIFEAKFETFSATRKIQIMPMGYRIEVKYIIDYRSDLRKDLKGRVYMTR